MAQVLIRNVEDSVLATLRARAAARLPLAFDRLIPLAPLALRAVAISRDLDDPAYDCFYLALAEDQHATLVTADGRLLNRLRGTPWAPLAVALHTLPPGIIMAGTGPATTTPFNPDQ
jgi:predicted nucleic acid-binding protein